MDLRLIKGILGIVVLILGSLLYISTTSAVISTPASITVLHHDKNVYGSLWVYDQHNRRCLSFVPPGTTIQSCMLPATPNVLVSGYTKMMTGALLMGARPQRILMIGLGGGSLPKAYKVLVPEAHIDVVELNPLVTRMAEQYFGFVQDNSTKVYAEDGYKFVQASQDNSYDLILLDAFSKDYIPESFLTNQFMNNIQRILSVDGVLAMNTFQESQYKKIETKLVESVFGEYVAMSNFYNRILIAKKGEIPSVKTIAQNATVWENKLAEVGVDKLWLIERFGFAEL